MKDEMDGQIMKKTIGLQPKTYSFLKDDIDEGKKAKDIKRSVEKENCKLRIIKIA